MGAACRDSVMVIGDTITFKITINESTLQGSSYTAPDDITFTIKKDKTDETPVLQASITNGWISLISSSDTEYVYLVNVPKTSTASIKEGPYYYDLALYFSSGSVRHTILMGVIKFIKGIS